MLIVLSIGTAQIASLKRENQRVRTNATNLLKDSEVQLRLTKRELKNLIDQRRYYETAIKDCLDIKEKNIKELTATLSTARYRISDLLTKETIIEKGERVEIFTLNKNTPEYKLNLTINQDLVMLDLVSYDTLYVVTHGYKPGSWFLPKLFSKRAYKTEVTNTNKYVQYVLKEKITID